MSYANSKSGSQTGHRQGDLADVTEATIAAPHSVKPKSTDESSNSQNLDIALPFQSRRSSSSFLTDRSRLSSEDGSDSHSSSYAARRTGVLTQSRTWQASLEAFWVRNKGLALVTLSQFFGVMMNVTTRLLEKPSKFGPPMHPFQILFARMLGTLVLSFTYQWLAKVKDAPFGPRAVWLLLVARGVGGFFGVYGMYYSLIFLPLSDATVITFLAPIVACYACSILIKEPFTRSEQIAGLVSFVGVIIIAHPASLLSGTSEKSSPSGSGTDGGLTASNATTTASEPHASEITPEQRLKAVALALVGVFGAACAYTTIRWIGQRAHPLISVNYFAAWSALVSTVGLLASSNIQFQLPAGWVQWGQLIFLGVCGFVMQFLLTAGLAYEKSSRATNMVYTQMLFALAFDKIVWDSSPGLMSILGSSLILGSALYVAVLKNQGKENQNSEPSLDGEEQGLMQHEAGETEGRSPEAPPLRDVQEVQLRTLRV